MGGLHKFRPPKKLFGLHLHRTHLSSCATGHRRTPHWTSSNHILQNHPRLLSLEACPSLPGLRATLAFAVVSGLFHNPFVSSRLLLHATSFDFAFSSLIFRCMESPNLFSWNTVIRAAADSDDRRPSVAFSLYAEMLQRATLPDKYTFPFLLKACRSPCDLGYGRLFHCHALIFGLGNDAFMQTALMSMYLSCGHLVDARHVFDEITQRDVVVWTATISGLVDRCCHEDAFGVFKEMRMFDQDVTPNVATMVSAMSAVVGLGSLALVKSLHANMEKVGLEGDVFVRNSLIDAYAKCGSIACALQAFDSMSVKDLHSWTAMITALASHGLGREAIEAYSRMCETGVLPDSTTFIAVLSACSHAGLVNEGIEIFNSMERAYKIVPEQKHYGCMVDLLSRAGLLARAYDFIIRMPMKPNLAILGALLSACRAQNDLELGELVAKKIESLCQYKGGADVLLSNMYADQQRWHGVVSIREAARKDAKKPPAQSWI
ncbi:unnamed protein product [Musa acuminata subsp. burmannicoides]